ncbi:hypothetical protein GIB67_000739 [Kingdonia uniflora]|uniref:Sister chromatid cohesion protein n=1 Tax=Kingdonia uniflora TaxID=39325 RepID=A0A7J7NDB1_9MAGN|nr:hypothetical protein GIB67_000739 [Kingdonia uniflora]
MGSSGEGFGLEKACRLSNTTHSEVAPCLPLPLLPVFCGALDQELRLFDETSSSSRSINRKEVFDQASRIADLLNHTDVSYLNLRDTGTSLSCNSAKSSSLYNQVLRYNSEAFEYSSQAIDNPGKGGAGAVVRSPDGAVVGNVSMGFGILSSFVAECHAVNEARWKEVKSKYVRIKFSTIWREANFGSDRMSKRACNLNVGLINVRLQSSSASETKSFEQHIPNISQVHKEYEGTFDHHSGENLFNGAEVSASSRKPKVKRKGSDDVDLLASPDSVELKDSIIRSFCEVSEDICGRAETVNDDQDEADAPPLSSTDIKVLVDEIISIRAKNILHLVPVDTLVRLLNVLDRQIRGAEGLSIDENLDSDGMSLVICSLESTHAALALMTHHGMPKQLYKEEIIERILDFSRSQIMDCMCACDPSYRTLCKPSENGALDGEDDDEADVDFGSAGKKRRGVRSFKTKKSTGNKVSASVSSVLQKLCTILSFLKDLLLIERLPDSCILQLVKTSFTTLLVDNIQLLQLKAISLICGVFSSYTEHRNHLIDETIYLLWKLPFSKRAIRAYHLPDEEQRQIQMITALLIQLVQCCTNLPETLSHLFTGNSILEDSIDASYATKCNEASTKSCALFWTRVLNRLGTVKAQEVSELKVTIENIVMDLLTTLNLPEYPASALILEVLCVLLLQNAGVKCKEISSRTLAIDLLGTIAARMKHDAVVCSKDKFWIFQELSSEDNAGVCNFPKDMCSLCLDARSVKLLSVCDGCQRLYHADCMGIRQHDPQTRACLFCLCKKQLNVLKSYCKAQCKVDSKRKTPPISESTSGTSESITNLEIIQQMLLSHLQGAGSTDGTHLFARWFYLCVWYKDDPNSQENFIYYLARLKLTEIIRDFGTVSSLLTRESAKKISLALGQKNSFSRGFDKIFSTLLASLRENSPILRAKALRAVSIIVEADPEVLCDKRVQSAVEGRFSDSAISAREAALELVGRHIASHPDVGLKASDIRYFEKVAERVKDTGVSVRKRAIKIIRDMCTSNANFSGFTRACIEIISRVSDEESSIQDLVCKTFYEFWFEEPSEIQTQFIGDGSSVPLEVAKKTEQVVEMLKKMPNHQLLVTVIRRNLALDFFPQSAKAIGINPMSLSAVRKRCELMCKCLLEKILQVEETNNEEVEARALPYVLVLHAFSLVDPSLCAPASDPSQFVVTLQPYLKNQADHRAVAQLLESLIFVIDAVLPLLRKPSPSVVEELEQDLRHMIVRHSFLTVVHASIKCLCSLSKVAGKGATLVEYLIQVFLKYLDTLGADNKQQIGRNVFCLGLLIRYGNELLVACVNSNVNYDKILNLLKKYLHSEDIVIKVRSLQALGFVLIARPEYMLERDIREILEATLSSGSDARLKMQALQNMHEYLLDAESQMGTDKNGSSNVIQYPEEGGHSVPVAAGAGDTNICGGIIQLYWEGILGRCMDMNEEVRQSALKIVEVVLRQGLVHPITCVPYLIALETDAQEVNSKLAHHLLLSMNEKHPDFFESRLGDGLQMSFNFIHSLANTSLEYSNQGKPSGNMKAKSDGNTFVHARLGVSRIYRLIRGNRVSRNKFLSSVVRKFDSPSCNQSVIPFLMYCTEILASLPFTAPDEPLYLIYTINRVLQVRSGSLEATMKALSSCSIQEDKHAISDENGVLQQDSSVLQQEPYSSAHSVSIHIKEEDAILYSPTLGVSCDILKDNLQSNQADCQAAIALQLLLKLKRHLKVAFGLSDARCQEFSPNDPLKLGEALSRQNIPFDIRGTHISLPTSHKEMIERYQEFKVALKDDTVDYSAYTSSIKRKRPAARSSRASGRSSRPTGFYDEEGDDDIDEDWAAGKISDSGRKSNVGRGRQRL